MSRLRRAAHVALATVVFLIAAVAGVLLHLDSPVTRRFVVARVNAALAASFEGKITVEEVGRLGLHGLAGARVRMTLPDGRDVVRADGVRVRASVIDITRSALFGEDVAIAIDEVSVDHADVSLDEIARAFVRRGPIGPKSTGARALRLRIAKANVTHAWVHGAPSGVPRLDVDVTGLEGTLRVVPDQTSIDVTRVSLRARGMPKGLNPEGAARAQLCLPSTSGRNLGLVGAFDGAVGGIPAALQLSVDGARLNASVDVPPVAAGVVRALFPDAPVVEDASAHAEAHGELPRLAVGADVTFGAGTIHAAGTLTLGDPIRLEASADARSIDLRALSVNAPRSLLAATVTTTLAVRPDGTALGDFTLDVLPGSIGEHLVPSAAIRGGFADNAAGVTVHGEGSVNEDGAPIEVAFVLTPDGVVDMTARGSIARLDRVTRLGDVASGSAEVQAAGRLRLADATIDATLDADLRDVVKGTERLARGHLRVTAKGPLAAPIVDARLTGTNLDIDNEEFSRVVATAHGTLATLYVEVSMDGVRAPDVRASAKLDLGRALGVRDARVTLSRDGTVVTARAASVRITPGGLEVDGAVLEGLGRPAYATVHMTRGALLVRANARGIALSRLAELLRGQGWIRGGRASFDVDLVIDRNGATGNVVADVTDASIGKLTGVNAHVEAAMQRRHGSGLAHISLGELGSADVKAARVGFGGQGPLELGSWRKGWGKIDLEARFDLAKIYPLLPEGTLPLDGMSGILAVTARAARGSETDFAPELSVSARTEGLVLVRSAAAHITGIEAELEATVDANTGAARTSTRLVDKRGAFVTLVASSNAIPYRELFATGGDVVARLTTVPFSATLALAKRDVGELPASLGLEGTKGEVEGTLDFLGSVREPRVKLAAAARRLRADDSPLGFPLDVEIAGLYDGVRADVDFKTSSSRALLMDGAAHVDLRIADALGSRAGTEIPWEGSAQVHLRSFPVSAFSALADRGVRGRATGEIAIVGLHSAARANAALTFSGLQVGTTKYAGAKLTATVDERALRAVARIDQTDGFAEVDASAGVTWGRALLPAWDASQRFDATMKAKSFRAATLMPAVDTVFAELDGRIDADARASIDPKGTGTTLEGTVIYRDGIFELASVGTELHDAKATLTLSPDGTIRLDDVSARGPEGRVEASAVAHTKGLRLVDATASLKIPKGEAIPLDVRGAQVGDVYGELKVRADASPDSTVVNVGVDVPTLHVDLPLASSHGVKDRDELPGVHVGVFNADRFTRLPIDGRDLDAKPAEGARTQYNVLVRLGDDVEIKRGTTLKVALDGNPVLTIKDKAVPSGQVRLKSGVLQVQGKKFEIEKGTVSFVGPDPSNPLLVVTAGWTAPDGTRVYADFKGPLKTGKVTLRSEPARPRNEILAIILFGSADGSATTPYAGPQGDTATRAGSAAGGLAAEGLSQGIDELTGLDVAASIDTSNSASPRPEVEWQIARSISLQVAFVLGTPPPGTAPDRTFTTIDWRFSSRWSLETTFGDLGSTFADVIWRYRY